MSLNVSRDYPKKLMSILAIILVSLSIIVFTVLYNPFLGIDETKNFTGGIKIEPTENVSPNRGPINVTRTPPNLAPLLRLEIEYEILDDNELSVKALEYLRMAEIEGAENLTLEDIAIIKITVILMNVGDINFYVFNNGYCGGVIPFMPGKIYNLTGEVVNAYPEFFWEINNPVGDLNIEIESGNWYAPAIFCTDDLRTYLVEPGDRYENTYVFIFSRPFKGVVKVEVEAGIYPYDNLGYEVVTREIVIEIER